MLTSTFFRRVMPFLLLAGALAGCGSNVTTSPEGQSGSGADGSGSGASGSANNGAGAGSTGSDSGAGAGATATASATAASGPGSTCDAFCAKLEALGCDATNCPARCAEALVDAKDCADELETLISCVSQAAASCADFDKPPPACAAQAKAFASCQGGGCGPEECGGTGSSGGQTSCECKVFCGMETLSTSCAAGSSGPATCQCFVDGMIVGSCTQPSTSDCGIKASCCAMFF